MLTNNDLKQIQKLLNPIQIDVSGLKQDMTVVKNDVKSLTKTSKSIQKDISKIKEDQKIIIVHFDQDINSLEKRADRIEMHLAIAS